MSEPESELMGKRKPGSAVVPCSSFNVESLMSFETNSLQCSIRASGLPCASSGKSRLKSSKSCSLQWSVAYCGSACVKYGY